MKNKKGGLTTSTIILIIVFIIGLYFGYKTFNQKDKITDLENKNKQLQEEINKFNQAKLKSCPDELIINQIPSTVNSSIINYFIINGDRKEISDFDLKFVIENCDFNKTIAR